MSYALDLNATLATNYVETSYVRPAEGVWMFVMEGGAFYTKDLVVRNSYDGRELEPLTQYRALETISDAVLESKKEVCAVIVVTDSRVNQITVKRRVVGGRYQTIGSDILDIVDEAKINALDSTSWGQIVGKPYQLPSEAHTHYDKEVYGLETAIYIMGEIKTAITSGDKKLFGMFYQYIDRQFTQLNAVLNENIARLNAEVEKNRKAALFQPNEVVIFTDETHPRDRYGYGVWERLPDGLLMMTADNTKLGKRKKIGEGPDYTGHYYAAWRYVSETLDMFNLPSMRFTTTGSSTVTSGSNIKVRNRTTGVIIDAVASNGTYTVTIPTVGSYEIYMDNMSGMLQGAVFKGAVKEVTSWHETGYVPFNFTEFGTATVVFNSDILTRVPLDLHSTINNTRSMFQGAAAFNQAIGAWNMDNVTDMSNMFKGAAAFNQDISGWKLSDATTVSGMFDGATAFNKPISNWDVSNVRNFSRFLAGATTFNQHLDLWNIRSATDLSGMFQSATNFNQDLSKWNVTNVTNMANMFNGATRFNSDLSWWCVSKIASTPSSFAINSSLAAENMPLWGTCPIPASQVVFTINGLPTTMYEATTHQLNVTDSHPDLTVSTITWTSSNTDVLSVNSSGLLTALTVGTSTVTAIINGRYTVTKSLTVNAVSGTVNGPATVIRGRPNIYKLVTDPTNYPVADLKWSVVPAADAVVDQTTGTITVNVANQNVTVIATVNNVRTFSKTIFVEDDVANMTITTATQGFNAYDYFVAAMGRAPRAGEEITMTINPGVALVGHPLNRAGMHFDSRFNNVGSIKLINYGIVLGRGGDGGDWYSSGGSQPGDDGGTGIVNLSTVNINVTNHSILGGGGGGGSANRSDEQWGYGGGGGAPYGTGGVGGNNSVEATDGGLLTGGVGGGNIGADGADWGLSAQSGGLAGFIKSGLVSITNIGSGQIRGR